MYSRDMVRQKVFTEKNHIFLIKFKNVSLLFYKTRFNVLFLFSNVFYLKTLNCECKNNSNLKHLCTETEKSKLIADFVVIRPPVTVVREDL